MLDLTRLLRDLHGDSSPPDEIAINALYDEIRRLARSCMRRERGDHTLVPTALANEAYLRLFGATKPTFENREEFFAAAATTLRRILVEHSRRKASAKRGGEHARRDLDADSLTAPCADERLLAVDDAVMKLAAFDPQKARLVELRFFAGLSVEEAAVLLGRSERTVARDWRIAAAFLRAELGARGGGHDLDA